MCGVEAPWTPTPSWHYQIGHSSSCVGTNISVELTAFVLKVKYGAAEFFKLYGRQIPNVDTNCPIYAEWELNV